MKKFTLMFSFLLALGLATANAQADAPAKDKKSCAHSCAGMAKASASTDADAAAAQLASKDETIERKVSETSGQVSYVRTVSNDEGVVTKEVVEYDAATGTFVKAAATGAKGCCSGSTATSSSSCCSKGKAAEAEQKPVKKSST